MFLDQINLNHVRVFETVYRLQNMTLAAKELHLTQSGVSQHIRSFEESLKLKLFDRVMQKLVPTDDAHALYGGVSKGLESMEMTLAALKGESKLLRGRVHIGVPMEFGANVVIPTLAKFSEENPGVAFDFRVGLASEMNALLLRGEVDVAFVDAFALDRRISLEKVYDEVLDLCIHPDLLKGATAEKSAKNQKKFFEDLDYVDYQADQAVLNMWFEHHFQWKNPTLRMRATLMDVHGVASLIGSGFGAGVLPHHLVVKIEKEGKKLHTFKGCGKPLKNTISMASLEGRTFSPAMAALKSYFLKAFQG